MNGLATPEIRRIISVELERLGLSRLSGMFAVEHNVPRGTHKVGAVEANSTDAETLDGHPASDFALSGHTHSLPAHGDAHEAGGSDIVDADLLDGNHASAFALSEHNHDATYSPLAKGVTNGDSHDHNGGDGAQVPERGLTLSDVTTGDVNTARHGLVPKAPNDTTKFLRGDGTWAAPAGGGGLGYILQVGTNNMTTFGDGTTYYIGSYFGAPVQTVMAYVQIPIPKAGTLKSVYIGFSIGTPATPDMGEEVNVYFRKNSTDTLLGVVELTDAYVIFQASGLSVSVAAGDYICIKLVNPAFSYNPQNIKIIGTLYFE